MDLSNLPVSELMRRSAVSCPPDTPIADAARLMRDARVSSLAVTDPGSGALVGLVTVRDMANRVVAEGVDTTLPIRQVMTQDPTSLPPDALGSDVLNIMFDRRVGHLPVVDHGRFLGMVTQTDLIRQQALSGSVLMRDIALAPSVAALTETTRRIPELLASMVAAHVRHEVVTRRITDVADAVTRRLLVLAQDSFGPAPQNWLWAACGSQGRQEQTGTSDQDNCLILADDADAADPYWERLAGFVCDGLNDAGYVYCPGDMMATNPRWRQTRRVWRDYFRNWIDEPTPEAQMLASVMLDLRGIEGTLALLDGVQAETLALAQESPVFVAHMIFNSLKHVPPLGLLRGLAPIRSGDHRGQIDMKMSGVVPVIDMSRVYALKAGLTPVNTRARIEAAESAGLLSSKDVRGLLVAYDLIQTLRLDHQARMIRAGQSPDNYLAPADLPDLESEHLRDAFLVVRTMQAALGQSRGVPI